MSPEVREQVRIAPDIARVLGKVFFVVELGGINEDRDKTYIVLADAASDERGMPCVERTHGGYQSEGLVLLFASLYMLEEFLLGGDDLHILELRVINSASLRVNNFVLGTPCI